MQNNTTTHPTVIDQQQLITLESVMDQAARAAITITSEHLAQAETIKQERLAQLQAAEAAKDKAKSPFQRGLDSFLIRYPALQDGLIKIGNLLMAITQTVAVAFGVPAILLIAVIAEYTRVHTGILLFEVHQLPAVLVALTLVSSNLVLKFVIHYRESRAGWAQPEAYEFSLRIAWQWLKYKAGHGNDWKPTPKSPAHAQRSLLGGVSSAILVLALTGSMETAIAKSAGNWLSAIGAIITQSSLQEIVVWVLSVVTAFALVRIVQTFGEYVAHAVSEIILSVQSNASDRLDRLAELAGATALLAIFKDLQRQRRVAASQAADLPYQEWSIPVSSAVSVKQSMNTDKTAGETARETGSETTETARETALRWLQANPNHELSITRAAKTAGVNRSAMNRAMKDYQKLVTNGGGNLE